GANVSIGTGIALEAILTVVLLVTVFGTAVDSRGPKIGGLAIGLAITADILVGGPVTGAAMNPARWFGPALASGFLDNAVVWIVGPLLGAAIAAILYRFVFSSEATGGAAA
ncbi:MAG TPA: aquaporin, partial [Candidatus Acidoferrum sp.]|nr:aquaporin [Candidatus Acidoferrum sp.]